jgi:tetratricopeptide (TPR) repeat protein
MNWSERALALAETSADPEARRWLGSLANNLGWAHHDAGDFVQALDCFQRALDWQRTNGHDEAVRIARWSVARTLRSLGRIEEALAEQGALRAELAEVGGQDGYVDEELGECLLALERPEDARPHSARAYAALSRDPWLREQEPERLRRLAELAAG